MSSFLAALQFLLILPAVVRRPFKPLELGRATGFYPMVGLLLGALIALIDVLLAYLFPAPVRSAIILAVWIALTGALHFDGFLDACDGLLGGATPESRMEIMRDERTGAYALAAGALLLLIMYSSLNALSGARLGALILAPVLGRLGMTLAIVAFPYARPEGLGRDVKDHARPQEAVLASLTTLVVVAALSAGLRSYSAAAALLSSALVWWLSCRFVLSRVPGMTGDTYGAINMLIEASVLLTFVAVP